MDAFLDVLTIFLDITGDTIKAALGSFLSLQHLLFKGGFEELIGREQGFHQNILTKALIKSIENLLSKLNSSSNNDEVFTGFVNIVSAFLRE